MNNKFGIVLCTALLAHTTSGQPSVSVGVSVPLPAVVFPSVEIRAESDFYEPLTPYGRWEVVGTYGRCWIPGRVDADWRPYSDGYWQRTDAGWYWVSEEPWGWATYHYGRWDLSAQFGWYWVPQIQWAPAWVSWHSGGGYIGWAPLYPSARFVAGGSLQVDVRVISPRAYVFVEQRNFLEPVRRSTVVVNNTTIINKTVNITNTRIVNNTVINEGPQTQVIEQASARKVQALPVGELRHKQEAEVIARQQVATQARGNKGGNVQIPVRSEAAPAETKAPLDAQRRAKESEATAQQQLQKSARDVENKTQVESQRRANEAAAKAQEEAQSKTHGRPELRPSQEQIVRGQDKAKTTKAAAKTKGEGKSSPPENPPAPPKSSP